MRTALLLILATHSALAAGKPPVQKPQSLDLGLPKFDAIPKGEPLQKPAVREEAKPQTTPASATYEVVRVQHGRAFVRKASGAEPTQAMPEIKAEGEPLKTERFSTVVRVRCKDRVGASIDVAVVDASGAQVMSASGQFGFRSIKGDEVDYQVDWEPTGIKAPGTFQVTVAIGGNPAGTWPLTVTAKGTDRKP